MSSTARGMTSRLSDLAVCGWFLFLALMAGTGLFSVPPGPLTLTALGALLSRWLTTAFLLLVVWLTMIRRRPVSRAGDWTARLSALLGTNLVLLGPICLPPCPDLGVGLQTLATLLMAASTALALVVLAHLGRSFSIGAEARALVTDGPYAFIRHPLYTAEQIGVLGLAIQYASVEMAAILLVHLAAQIHRMNVEEKVLRDSFPEYGAYQARTARVIPGIW